jgi:iron complex transport system permease protein
MKKALLYFELLVVIVVVFLIHNHTIKGYQPTSRGIALIIIGAAIGISSTLFQGYFKKVIAEPGIMGISSGAALGAVIALKAGADFGSYQGMVTSIFFALITFYIFYFIKNKFLINGILLTATLSLIIILLTLNDKHNGLFWTLGSFTELNKVHVKAFAPLVEVGIITSFLIARRIKNNSPITTFFVALGPFTNVTGALIGFGLFIPAITRKMVKGDTRKVLSYAALIGPILLLTIDILISDLNNVSVSVIAVTIAALLPRTGKEQPQSE